MAPSSTQKPASQAQGSQKKPKASTRKPKTVNFDGECLPSLKSKKFDPLTAFAKQLTPLSTQSSNSNSRNSTPPFQSSKGKGKAKENSRTMGDVDDSLWVDKYEPTTEAELAVHVKKVNDVRTWLNEAFDGGPSGKLSKYRRILALTGPAGTGKTSTIRVLAGELGFEVLEWRNSVGESVTTPFDESNSSSWNQHDFNADYEGLFAKFEAFLTRASSCQNVFASSSKHSAGGIKRRIILLEDLPNVLHHKTQAQLHAALNSFVTCPPSNPPVPVVIIVSDAGMRGESSDERMADGRGWGREKNQVVDLRTVLSKDLLGGPYVTEIGFNPIAPTLLRKALQAMLNTHFASGTVSNAVSPSKEILEAIVESANGDIRSAIMALQFACIVEIPGKKKKGKTMVMEAITRREQTLALFHLIGKVLYSKRKGDPSTTSTTAKDLQKERDLDASLKDLPKLPPHLAHHERRTSRVDVNMLYADSPIDSSLFSLYIHQNYPQFCNEIDEVGDISDWLSWVDSSGGEAWFQTNPHQFHLLSLGTLHSLPSPVPRRSQKYFKPEFFAYLQKEKDAWEGVRATRDWVMENELSGIDSGWRPGGWSKNEILLELGGILKAQDMLSIRPSQSSQSQMSKSPPIHRLFSRMEFTRGGTAASHARRLNEGDVGDEGLADAGVLENDGADLDVFSPKDPTEREQPGGWLDSDDIEDFD